MVPQYKIWPREFSSNDCNEIVKRALELYPRKAGVTQGLEHDVRNADQRTSTIRWIERHADHNLDDMFSLLDSFFKKANLYFGFNLTYFESIQFAEYKEEQQGHYTWHPDWFLETKDNHQRKLSLTMQLTDSSQYDGGDFQFHGLTTLPDEQELRAQGTVVVFPSYLTHRVTTVTRGCRHSLVAWYDGPEFK